jgi:hypothetical protein
MSGHNQKAHLGLQRFLLLIPSFSRFNVCQQPQYGPVFFVHHCPPPALPEAPSSPEKGDDQPGARHHKVVHCSVLSLLPGIYNGESKL